MEDLGCGSSKQKTDTVSDVGTQRIKRIETYVIAYLYHI